MAQRPSKALFLLAAGAAAGAIGVAAVKHFVPPTPEQHVFNEMVRIFDETATAQKAEREEHDRRINAYYAEQREQMKQAAIIFDTEMMRLEMNLPSIERKLNYMEVSGCILERKMHDSYTSLDRGIREFDEEVKKGQRPGKPLRTARQSEGHQQLLGRYAAIIQQKCS